MQQRGGGGDLVGQANQRHFQRAAEQVRLPAQIDQGRESGGADRDAATASAPGAAEAVADHRRDLRTAQGSQLVAKSRGGAIRVGGQQQHLFGFTRRGHVRMVHAGICHHKAQPVLHDEQVWPAAHDAGRFRQNYGHETRILTDCRGKVDGSLRRDHSCKVHQPRLGFGNDLLRQHDNVAVAQLAPGVRESRDNQPGDIVTGLHDGQTRDGE